MTYKAKFAYQDKKTVETYDISRFKKIKGKIDNYLELWLIAKALKIARISPPASILDVPCGTGRLTLFLSKKGYAVTGIDISLEMVKFTNRILAKNLVNSPNNAIVGNAESLPFLDNSFDATVSLRLLGHVPPSHRFLIIHELKRVSKHYVILAYYDRLSFQYFLRKRKRRFDEWYPTTFREIKFELMEADLRIIKILPLFFKISETVIVLSTKTR